MLTSSPSMNFLRSPSSTMLQTYQSQILAKFKQKQQMHLHVASVFGVI